MTSLQDLDNSLQQIARRSLDLLLKGSPLDHQWSLRNLEASKDIKQTHSIIITISSFRFRLFCFLHVNLDQLTRQYVAEATQSKIQDTDDTAVLDYLMEMSNSLTGNVKRFIQSTCPPLGMSTPNLLSRGCMVFDDVLCSGHSTHLAATRNGESKPFFALSCMLNLQKEEGFMLPSSHELEPDNELDSSGELELF